MARKSRKDLSGNYFHVMVQGIGKEHVFPSDNFKAYFLNCLQKTKEIVAVKILAFCVMDNHAHVLISCKDTEELSSYLKRVNEDYARYYNRINQRVGYVFRDRFKSEIIKNENHLVYCAVYIQNNPVKAGIVSKAKEYKFSSLINYLKGCGIVDFDEAARFFDVSKSNMLAMMRRKTNLTWMEHDDKEYEDKFVVLEELLKRHGISNVTSRNIINTNKDLAVKIALEIKERCGTSLRKIADLFEMSREKLRLLCKQE
jgi:REP element-mobilizing transposase RayT